MRITTDQLRDATNVLLAHLDATGRSEVDVDVDYYWSVPTDDRYDPYRQPAELGVGQLSDDWAEVRAIGAGDKEPVGYGLVWLASVLRAIGERNVV